MTCLCASTRRAARRLTRYYEEQLAPANITPAQFELLTTLAYRPGLPQSDLAEALDLDQTTLSRNLRVLIHRKWVKRTTSSEDRRQSAYAVAPEGKRVWAVALPYWQRAQRQMQALLGSDWETTHALLDKLNPPHLS